MQHASDATLRCTGCNVPALTTQQAAELTGRNRTTIWRACKTGRLSATKNDIGEYLIDPAELERAYGRLHVPQLRNEMRPDARQPDATSNETTVLQREVDLLREQVRELVADKADLRSERDRLLNVLERNAEQLKLLTDERTRRTETREVEPTEARKGWLERLLETVRRK
jgi:hypothetical protein